MKKFLFLSLLTFSLFGYQPVHAQDLLGDIQRQNQSFAGQQGANLKDADPRLIFAQVIKVLLSIVGVLFTGWTFFGGFLVFTSSGEPEKIERAKSIITNGVIGIILILGSYGIARTFSQFWLKAQKNPFDSFTDFHVTPDTDFYNKDPLQQNTAIPQ